MDLTLKVAGYVKKVCSLTTDLRVYYSKVYVCLHRTERHCRMGRAYVNKEIITSFNTTVSLLDNSLIELHVST